jgi:hypothetical protein
MHDLFLFFINIHLANVPLFLGWLLNYYQSPHEAGIGSANSPACQPFLKKFIRGYSRLTGWLI